MPRRVRSGVWPGRTPRYPSLPGRITSSTISVTSRRSGVTMSRWIAPPDAAGSAARVAMGSGRLLHLPGLLDRVLDPADHVEGLLRQFVVFPLDDLLEAAHRLGDRDVLPLKAGELFGHEERLRQEALDLARPGDGELVVLRQLVDPEDGDDVLQVLVTLQDPLDGSRHRVVLLPDDPRVEDARRRGQRVDRRVDPQLGDLPRQ